jgi:hypothetical protein
MCMKSRASTKSKSKTRAAGKRTAAAATRKVVTKGAKAGRRTLLPVMRPAQNMREIIKQLVMLEDHMYQRCKRCTDCTNKHMIMIEGLAEECATLCGAQNAQVAKDADAIASKVRVLHHAYSQGRQAPGQYPTLCTDIAAELRALRKALMAKYATLPVDALPTEETRAVRKVLETSRRRRR